MSILSLLGKRPDEPLIALAPMAGVSDLPFRTVAHRFGADYSVTEMASAMPHLRDSEKNQRRLNFVDDDKPKILQIIGNDADDMAVAAKYYADLGADIIDINMGCPAKKVCKKAAGSALLDDLDLVTDILEKVVAASPVPVTLKTRLGTHPENITLDDVAKRAEDIGIQLLTVHGRTRACKFRGSAWFDDIARVKQHVDIPIIANGDINSVEQAKNVLAKTKADGVMIARGAMGNPRFFSALKAAFGTDNENFNSSNPADYVTIIRSHIEHVHAHYGEQTGVRMARKHIQHYVRHLGLRIDSQPLLTEQNPTRQLALLADALIIHHEQYHQKLYRGSRKPISH